MSLEVGIVSTFSTIGGPTFGACGPEVVGVGSELSSDGSEVVGVGCELSSDGSEVVFSGVGSAWVLCQH